MKNIPAVVVLLACLLMSSACANSNKTGEHKDTAITVGQSQQTQQDAQEADKEPDKSSNFRNKKLYLYEGVNGERYFLYKQSDTKESKLIREILINEGSLFYSGLVSKDNKKVAWVEGSLSSNEEGVEGVANIYVSDIDGQNQIKVVKNIYREEELTLVSFNNSRELYYGMSFSGLGGRCLYEYVEDLYKINTTTGESEFIFGTTEETRRGYNNSEYITAFSNNGNYVAYFQNNSLNVKDIHSGKKVSFPMPFYDEILAYGSGLFSPDNKKIVFQMAIEGIKCEENDGYIIKHIVADLENESIKEVCETPETELDPAVKWTSNNKLELKYGKKSVVIDLDNQNKYNVIDLMNIPNIADKKVGDTVVTDVIATFYAENYGIDLISKIDIITFKQICISSERKEYWDYLIVARVDSNGTWYTDLNIMSVLKCKSKNSEGSPKGYELCFSKGTIADFVDKYGLYELIDIDSDGGQEIIFKTFEAAQGGWEHVQMHIFKYKDQKYESIFSEGIHERKEYPYCYDNSYEFIQNKKNPKFYDIVFKINTQCDEEYLNSLLKSPYYKDYDVLPPVHDEVIFSFDGEQYIPNKTYDYSRTK